MITLGTTNYLCPLNARDIQVSMRYAEELDSPASLLFLQAVRQLMVEHRFKFPENVLEAICLYAELVALFEAQL